MTPPDRHRLQRAIGVVAEADQIRGARKKCAGRWQLGLGQGPVAGGGGVQRRLPVPIEFAVDVVGHPRFAEERLRDVDRHEELDLLCVRVPPRRDADDVGFSIDGRTAGVAAINSDVRLKDLRVGDVVLDRGDRSVRKRRFEIAFAREPAADDIVRAARDFGIADRPHRVADADVVGIAELQRRKIFARHTQQREIGSALAERRRVTLDLERHLLAVRQLDVVDDRDVIDTSSRCQSRDVPLERITAIQTA